MTRTNNTLGLLLALKISDVTVLFYDKGDGSLGRLRLGLPLDLMNQPNIRPLTQICIILSFYIIQ